MSPARLRTGKSVPSCKTARRRVCLLPRRSPATPEEVSGTSGHATGDAGPAGIARDRPSGGGRTNGRNQRLVGREPDGDGAGDGARAVEKGKRHVLVEVLACAQK